MDLSLRGLQTKGIFYKLHIRFRIIGRKSKNIQKNGEGKYWSKSSMCYASMDSSLQALQTNEFFSPNFEVIFESTIFFSNNKQNIFL